MLKFCVNGFAPLIVVVCAVVLGASGCGSGLSLVPVSGKITVDGQPLSRGTLRFVPDSAKGNTSTLEPAGEIKDGSYSVFTQAKPGAPVGAYKVVVVAQEEIDSTNPKPPQSLVNATFGDPKTTPLSVEVKDPPAAGAYDLQVTK